MTDDLVRTAVQLGGSLDALAALAAYIRVEREGIETDPAVRDLLTRIAAELLGDADLTTATRGPGAPAVVGLARAFLHQGADLVANPSRDGSWDQADVTLLQGIGRLSGAIADAFVTAGDVLDGLAERLATPGARLLDVGTGTGWLAIASARTFPQVSVVGIDIFEPALELARANVTAEGLDDRIELRRQDATALDEPAAYDLIWLPAPFLPAEVFRSAVSTASAALRPGGWLLAGTFAGTDDRLSRLLTDLRIIRSGGHPWSTDEMAALMGDANLIFTGEVARTWTAPVRLFAGQRT